MLSVNNRVLLKHFVLFKEPEVLKGKITSVKKFNVEDDCGHRYDQTYYHIKLDNGKKIIVPGRDTKPYFFQCYKILLA